MNSIARFFLAIVLLPAGLYRKLGINTEQLRTILQYKLIMDDRRPNSLQQTQGRKKNSSIKYASIGTMLISLVMGVLYLSVFVLGADEVTKMNAFFTAFIFLLASMLISDFTAVLIDVRDNFIILPKPVNDRTVVMAKLLHILVHLGKVVIPMCIPISILLYTDWGLRPMLAFLALAILAVVFTIFLINAAYLLVLKLTTPERFRSIIAWFQVFMAIVLYAGYQAFPRIAQFEEIQTFTITDYWFAWLLPPYWFASGWTYLSGFAEPANSIYGLIASIVIPLVTTWLVIRYFAPSFNKKLTLISPGSSEGYKGTRNEADQPKSYAERLARLFTKSPEEKMAFLFAWKWSSRSREFALKVYPTIGYVIVWLILSLSRFIDFNPGSIDDRDTRIGMLTTIYFSAFILINAVSQVSYSEKHQASWIFRVVPCHQPGGLILGTFKSMACKFYLPIAGTLILISLIWLGPSILPNMLLGLSNQLVICALVTLLSKRAIPASLPSTMNDKSGNFLRAMALLALSGLIAIMHFFIFPYLGAVIVMTALSVAGLWLLLDQLGKTGWEELVEA
ncbi:hypothetical protein KJS94_11565 [Flavihumibacter rivuli]|uniref:hypothetical protein n=1 Tax=Flavihumibacter rivuli TaxID=2838156 RepID=UPI001BDEF4C1|nr:hypothetical protein [Flavihumibacter rivuli]ULQ55279.1 hypothetical protein KJS94_11565 [Flavihumibacter rivuli]